MISLFDLQNRFAQSLRYQGDASLCDIHSDHFSDEQRIQIYRNNVIHGFTDVLKAMYPFTLALIGNECFEQVARTHVLNTPSLSGNVCDYGQGFETTFTLFPKVIEAAPYISEVARLEALYDQMQSNLHKAFKKEYKPLATLHQLSPQEQQKIGLVSSSNVHSFESNFAIFDLIHAIQENAFEDLNINQTQRGYVQAVIEGDFQFEQLEENDYQLLRAIESNKVLSDINEHLLPSIPSLVNRTLIVGFI